MLAFLSPRANVGVKMKIYCAGPLFTPYHRAFIAQNAQRLRQEGFECFVPQEQEINLPGRTTSPREIFDVDLAGVQRANALVALLDGPDVSSGTACEIGIFYALMLRDPTKKGILGLVTDHRVARRQAAGAKEGLNFFTRGCIEKVGKICLTLDEIIEILTGWDRELQ